VPSGQGLRAGLKNINAAAAACPSRPCADGNVYAPVVNSFEAASVVGGPPSDPPAGMHGGNTTRQIAVLDLLEPRLADHLREAFLIRELADRFHEILVGLGIPCREFAKARNDLERVEIIRPVEHRDLALGKFQAQETSPG